MVVPILGIITGIFAFLTFISLVYKKLDEKLKFIQLEETDKRMVLFILILITVFDTLGSLQNVCNDYIPKLSNIFLSLSVIFSMNASVASFIAFGITSSVTFSMCR